jgi:hypothetical protein
MAEKAVALTTRILPLVYLTLPVGSVSIRGSAGLCRGYLLLAPLSIAPHRFGLE